MEDVDKILNQLVTYTDEQFLKEFRPSRSDIGGISDIVKNDMFTKGYRKKDLSLEQKVLICLKTIATGSFQNCSKDFRGVSQFGFRLSPIFAFSKLQHNILAFLALQYALAASCKAGTSVYDVTISIQLTPLI